MTRFASRLVQAVAWAVVSGCVGVWLGATGGAARAGQVTGAASASAATGAVASGANQAAPAPAEILQRLRQSVSSIKDARARVEAQVLDAEGRRLRSVVEAWVLRQPALVRLQVVEPGALAEQVYVIDFERQSLYVYLPITNQIVVQPIDGTAALPTHLSQLGPALWLQPVPAGFEQSVKLVRAEQQAGRVRYVLEGSIRMVGPGATPPATARPASGPPAPLAGPQSVGELSGWAGVEAASLQLWVDGSSWLAERLVALDARGREVATVTLQGLRVNTGLKAHELRRLPEGAELVRG